MSFYEWRPYESVSVRRLRAKRAAEALRTKAGDLQPVRLVGRAIAQSFWGKAWCDHLEKFSDFANRLPRGRTYVRAGAVLHLDVGAGRIEAWVSGTELYTVAIEVDPLAPAVWRAIRKRCQGEIGSMLELLEGRLSERVMAVVSDRDRGLFPKPREIRLECSCPDWAVMCKHVAAVLYGVGNRLDDHPELLFTLRGVDALELIAAEVPVPKDRPTVKGALGDERLAELFGIEIESASPPRAPGRRRVGRKTHPAAAPAAGARRAPPGGVPRAPRGDDTHRKKGGGGSSLDPLALTGASIRRLRKAAGLSVRDFARTLGVSEASVRRWEGVRGRVKLQARPLKALIGWYERRR